MDLTDLARSDVQPDSFDRIAHARVGRATAGISPASLGEAPGSYVLGD